MSIVVQNEASEVFAFVKGADSQVIASALPGQRISEAVDVTEKLASQGLRIMMFAYKELNAPKDNAEKMLSFVSELHVSGVESDLILLGVTAVEDELQDDVQATVEDFRKAGMKVWMLTGDKGLTAT